MALKNLFDMVKADRYTQDGREAIIKAQEAETEDKVYQIGEISQKTGLQKTANGWVKPKSGKQPGAKENGPLSPAKRKAERIAKMQKETGKAAPYGRTLKGTPKTPDDNPLTERTQKRAEGSKPAAENKTTIRQGPNTKTLNETPAEHVQKNLDAYKGYSPYDMEELVLKPSGYEKQTSARVPGGGQSITYTKNGAEDITLFFDKNGELENADVAGSKPATEEPGPDRDDSPERAAYERELSRQQAQRAADDPRGFGYEEPPMEPATPRREAVSAGRMMKDLDGNFWSRPEDFKEDITSRGWDVDEMTNEYAVISNEAGSQYEVRFDDHSDEGDLTVRNFKALQIDEDDDDDSLEDAAPSLSEIVDRVYNIGEISEKTGLQKTANGWVKPKKGAAPAKKENPTRTFEFKAGPDGNPVAGSGKEVKTYKTKKEAEAALKKQNAAAESIGRDEKLNKVRQVLNTALTPSGDKVQMTKSKITGDFHVLLNGKSTGGGFRDPQKAKEEFNAWIAGKKAPSESAKERINKRFDESEARSQKAMESKPEGRNFRSELEANPKGAYDFEKTVEKSIPLSAGDKEVLGNVKSFMREEGADYKDALKSVATGLVNGNKLHGDWYPEKEKSLLKIAKAVGMDEEVKSYVKTMAKGYDFGYSEDAAPRFLTGDCRIRIRKEKPALTGDTKIRVRK